MTWLGLKRAGGAVLRIKLFFFLPISISNAAAAKIVFENRLWFRVQTSKPQ